jgi:signal transduction histidine kinase
MGHKILFILLGLNMLLSSCNQLAWEARHLQRHLHEQQRRAEDLTQHLYHSIETNNFDSLWAYSQEDENIVFYVYYGDKMVYWSNAWLTSSRRMMNPVLDKWHFAQWDNAQGVCYRKKIDEFTVVVAIPLKYDYSITSTELHNSFILPFRCSEEVQLTYRQTDSGWAIYSYDGTYLFSMELPSADEQPKEELLVEMDEVLDNFSYRSIFYSDDKTEAESLRKLRTYYGLMCALIVILLLLAIFSLVRYRGFRRMRLGGKFQIVLTPMVLVILLSVFLASLEHSRRVFIETQQLRLTKKAQYVKMALQNMYFWDMTLSPANTMVLNNDLRDMSYAYEMDIHVYDLNGMLIGTSVPKLFQHGLLPLHIAPQPFFLNKSTTVQYEHIGDVRYLSAYTEFINGTSTKIGYIALPSFISQKEINTHLQAYMVKVLPLYLILLLAAIVVVWGISRMVTSSLGMVSNQLKLHRLGESTNHIDYSYSDEVGELVTHYNQMMDALADSTERLARTEREMAWRTMARQVAHEINNPLTPMKLTLQQLQRTKGTERFDGAFDRSTQLLIEQIDNLSHIAKSFSSFAKMPEVNPTKVDVAAKLFNFVTLMRNNPSDIPIRYVGPDEGVMAIADADQITQVFTNIVKNAMQAMQGRPNSDIIIIFKTLMNNDKARLDSIRSSNQEWIEISISDNGPGISQEAREKVFVPNFTTKNTGAGLGLPISKNIVEGSGGKITFHTSDSGTTFYIYLKKV